MKVDLHWTVLSGWVLFNTCASLNIIRVINNEVEMDWERSTCQRGKRQLGSHNNTWMDNIKMVPI
jgi:hypothetical protein